MSAWPEVTTAKSENRHEIKLAGAAISKRITEGGLDKGIFQLTNINLLNISDTCLTAIPDDISRLANLQSLLLYGNKITEFNENITSLKKLKVLDLSRNLLKKIPQSLNEMKELTNINLSSNEIEEMPKFTDFPNLLTIDMSNNKLTSFLDLESAVLAHLTDLKIKGNAIEVLPSYIVRSLPSLKNFDIGDNQLKSVPGEMASMGKLKELNLKGNKFTDKRFMKLVDQCRTKQVMDYIRDHCPKTDQSQPTGKSKGKKGKKEEPAQEEQECDLCHAMKILHVEDDILRVKIIESQVAGVRPYILCCIVNDLNFDETSFKKFIQMQTKLHDTICDKRNVATIATHDLEKIAPGDLVYTAKAPSALKLTPLSRVRPYSGEQLYLYLLEGKSLYPCLEDASGKVISFPPITNSEETKMSQNSKSMLVEVTSHTSLGACKTVMNKLLQECLLLGIGPELEPGSVYNTLTVQQVKVVDLEGNLKNVYPSRTDCVFEGTNIKVLRSNKK
ncbi:hypothetical protein HF086_018280 [Spodoptera exigua]|uniref:B3/B4 tRNA-binding domain-containing protein n=1 Tax=Spodoptera exigua TaxID=7107 RepID=A0A922MXR2_SPOEX|nr:hypothetical protein HF086_018280 [Spodoptera exigua]